jgi:hypothetical protein
MMIGKPPPWVAKSELRAGLGVKSSLIELILQADGVRAAMEAHDRVSFTANPVGVVRAGAGHGEEK